MRSTSRSLLVALAAALLLAYACGGDDGGVAGGTGATGATAGADASAGSGGTAGDAGSLIDSPNSKITSLTVEPASATIDVLNGTAAPAQFQAVAHYQGGSTATVQADWSFDRIDLGAISPAGSLAAHGTKGGAGTVTATVGTLSATASATINLHFEENSANLSQPDKDKFATPDTNPSGTFLYPYDKTVFARGILPPELMWSGGASGDSYKVEISDKNVSLVSYLNADPPSRWLMDKLVGSAHGEQRRQSRQCEDPASGRERMRTRPWPRPGPSRPAACAAPSTTGRSTPGR